MNRVDLHLHSNYSDGSDSIEVLVKKVREAGIKIFALTDHDTIEGCVEVEKIAMNGLRFIPSTELTCKTGKIKCHILGYNCDYKSTILLELIEKGKKLRRRKLETRIKYLKDSWGIELNNSEKEWLYSRKSVVKTHIANILVNRGLAIDNLSAMKKYLDNCKSGDTRFSCEEAIYAIVKSGGIPVWAHPLGGEGETHLSETEFLPQLKEMIKLGIKGLECFYSRYTTKESDFLIKCANENKLFITGGSDYHGSNKSNIEIGKLNVNNIEINAERINILNIL